jgi:uncharacterized protein
MEATPMPETMMRQIIRDDLTREAPFTFMRAEADETGPDDGRTIDGIGAVFNTPTVINSWEGTFEEVIAPGAFKKSLRETRPKMQFDHGHHPLIGSLPIGAFDDGYPREEELGLRVKGRLAENWLIEPVREAIASQTVDGMSFRFSVVNEVWYSPEGRNKSNPGTKLTNPEDILEGIWTANPDDPSSLLRRVLKELKIREVGPVVWPAYVETSVSVRSRVTIDLSNPDMLRNPEVRRTLAQAVFMADRQEAQDEDGPQSNGTPDDHPAPAEQTEEVRATEEAEGPEVSDPPSGEHPKDSEEAERMARESARIANRIQGWRPAADHPVRKAVTESTPDTGSSTTSAEENGHATDGER